MIRHPRIVMFHFAEVETVPCLKALVSVRRAVGMIGATLIRVVGFDGPFSAHRRKDLTTGS